MTEKKPKKISNSKFTIKNKFDFNSKTVKILIPIIFILFVMFVAFYVRSGPINLDGLNDNIKASTYSNIQNLLSQQINQQYPNLANSYKQELVQKEYKKVLNSGILEIQGQKLNINDIIKKNTIQVKSSFKAPNGQTYLNAIDPYLWLRSSTYYFENGYTGNKIIDGVKKDTLRLAPNGVKASSNAGFHIWLEAKLFQLNGLDKNSTIGQRTKAIYLIPVIFVMLTSIFSFLIIRKFSNDLFALFGSLLLVSIGTFVSRTVAGFVDTDAYNVFFPMIILAFLIYGFVYKNKYLTIGLSVLAGLFQGLFLWAWGNGWFIFVFILASLLAYLGYIIVLNFIHKIKINEFIFKIENDLYVLFSFIISSYIFTYLINKVNIFYLSYKAVSGSISGITSASITNIWPNVLSSVAELNPASFDQIISSVGGQIVFLIALIGVLFLSLDYISKSKDLNKIKRGLIIISIIWFILIVSGNFLISLTANLSFIFIGLLFLPIGLALILGLFNNNKSEKIFLSILLSIWMAGTIYMSLNGVRFILLLAPAFAISFGIGLYYISKIINDFFTNEFKIKSQIGKVIGGFVIISVLFFTLYSPIYTQANAISKGTVPNFDDAWYGAMNKIETNSNESAIITSWWDFGHFFSTVSNRGTTFDGGSQTVPASYWVGKLFLENNEKVSNDILRMLVCGNNKAFETMLSFTNSSNADAVKINKIINSTFGKNIKDTRKVLENNKYYKFNSNQIDSIMKYLACSNPREDFVITSGDMVGKAGVWAHWGSWDFTRKYVLDNYKSKSASQIAINIDENKSLIQNYINTLKEIDIKSSTQNIKKDNLINQWLAPYPSYIPIQSKYQFPCTSSNNTINCQNGIQINMKTYEIKSQFNSQIVFKNLIFPNKFNKLSKIEINKNGNVDVLLIPTGKESFNIMIMQTPLGASLFTKLFYLNGFELKSFIPFDSVQSATGNKVLVWKVNWNESVFIKKPLNNLNVQNVQFNTNNSKIKKIIGNNLNIS